MLKRVILSLSTKKRMYSKIVRLVGSFDVHELGLYEFPPYERYSGL